MPERFVPITEDHKRQIKILEESGLDYIIVCPPHIAGTYGLDLDMS